MSHAAPPTTTPFDPNDPSLFVDPPLWPKVVGIISIVLAALGITCSGCGVVAILVFIPMGEQQLGPAPAVMLPGPAGYALMAVGILLTFLLLGAGILTTVRRQPGRVLHLAWAALSIPLTIDTALWQYQQQQTLARWIADNPDSPWAQQGQNPTSAIIGLAIQLVLGLAYPVFCLVWFGLIKNKPHHLTGEHPRHDDNPFAPR